MALAPAHSPAAAARRLEAALHELHDSRDRRVTQLSMVNLRLKCRLICESSDV